MFQRLNVFASVAMLLAAASAQAGGGVSTADPCAAPGGEVHYVQKTIYTPQWATESRTVICTEYVQEQRQVTQTVYRCVPETQQVERSCVVMVPQTHTKTVPYTYCKPVYRHVEKQVMVQVPVWTQQERQYTAMVPHMESRQGVRQVCQWIEEQVPQTIRRDCGQWEVQMVQVPCRTGLLCCRRGCGSCCVTTVCQKVWVPNIVEEQVMVTVCRPQIVEQPYEYQVVICRPETRTCMVNVCHMQQEVRTVRCLVTDYETVTAERQVYYTVCVPQEKTWMETLTTFRQVAEEVTRTVTVCVPQQVEREVQVQVCQMVAQTVQVPVCTVQCCRPCCRRRCL